MPPTKKIPPKIPGGGKSYVWKYCTDCCYREMVRVTTHIHDKSVGLHYWEAKEPLPPIDRTCGFCGEKRCKLGDD
ncbi:hypothetical protein LCGC14_1562370 [marine sediment metagenome]|uniref:Uncharacterized protein n=1 Tax=marine sediment metagenome TaxID=412755 RepID=A0A0F9IM24_9ZZZZ